jgi:hypothetical protein
MRIQFCQQRAAQLRGPQEHAAWAQVRTSKPSTWVRFPSRHERALARCSRATRKVAQRRIGNAELRVGDCAPPGVCGTSRHGIRVPSAAAPRTVLRQQSVRELCKRAESGGRLAERRGGACVCAYNCGGVRRQCVASASIRARRQLQRLRKPAHVQRSHRGGTLHSCRRPRQPRGAQLRRDDGCIAVRAGRATAPSLRQRGRRCAARHRAEAQGCRGRAPQPRGTGRKARGCSQREVLCGCHTHVWHAAAVVAILLHAARVSAVHARHACGEAWGDAPAAWARRGRLQSADRAT